MQCLAATTGSPRSPHNAHLLDSASRHFSQFIFNLTYCLARHYFFSLVSLEVSYWLCRPRLNLLLSLCCLGVYMALADILKTRAVYAYYNVLVSLRDELDILPLLVHRNVLGSAHVFVENIC